MASRNIRAASTLPSTETASELVQSLGQTRFSIDHVYKGPYGSRVFTDMAIVEFTSNSVRESVLKSSQGKPLQYQTRAELKIDRAKSASQLSRNAFLRKAMDDLKNLTLARLSRSSG